MDALRVVAQVNVTELKEERDRLRCELREAKKALSEVRAAASMHSGNYRDLVWFGRMGRGWEAFEDPEHEAHYIARRMYSSPGNYVLRSDFDALRGDSADYHHGFHVGMLAASRLHLGLSSYTEDHVPTDEFYNNFDSDSEAEVPTLSQKLRLERANALESFPDRDT